MDTYGIINLTELDFTMNKCRDNINRSENQYMKDLYAARMATLQGIKELCLKLPMAEDVFNEGANQDTLFEDYMNQFITSKE